MIVTLAKNHAVMIEFFVVIFLVFFLGYIGFGEFLQVWVFSRKEDKAVLHQRIMRYLSALTYYRRLTSEGKIKFRKRLIDFMESKNFIGHKGFKVTEEMKVLISASATQLTFGLKEHVLNHYHTIMVSPEAFYSKMMNVYMKGGTSAGGNISLSWKDFVEGYEDEDDKYNLGLHEMAHALKLDVIKGSHFDERFASYLDNWLEIGSVEFAKMHDGAPSFLRAYGGTNMHEFFAVCVEHFFEVPEDFKNNLPDLYYHLSYLLNQDPLNVKEDYRLKDTFVTEVNSNKLYHPIPLKLKQNLKYANWHWTLSLMLTGIFVAPILIIILGSYTVIESYQIFQMIGLLGTAGLFQWIYFRNKGLFFFGQFVCYSYIGFGTCVTALILLMNYYIPIQQDITETHRIESYAMDRERSYNYVLFLENNAYDGHIGVRTMDYEDSRESIEKAKRVKYTFTRGLFGLKVLRGYELQ